MEIILKAVDGTQYDVVFDPKFAEIIEQIGENFDNEEELAEDGELPQNRRGQKIDKVLLTVSSDKLA